MKNNTEAIVMIIVYGYAIGSYITNAIQLFNCDFASPYKDEVIHAIGVFFPPLAGITVWF